MSECWRAVSGYEGSYEVSDLGSVRSLDRAVTHRNKRGTVWQTHRKGRAMSLCETGPPDSRHLAVVLYKDGKGKMVRASRLVLTTFVGPCPQGLECCHADDNQSNNRLGNLRWDTHRRNCADRSRNSGGLTESDVVDIRREASAGANHGDLAVRYGIRRASINRIVRRERWSHVL